MMLERVFGNLKTTVGGSVVGGAMMGAGYLILQQAGCQFGDVEWMAVLTMLFTGPAAVGAAATDNGKAA